MADWFIMVMLGAKLTLIGPLYEDECQLVKRVVFDGTSAICINREMIRAKQRSA